MYSRVQATKYTNIKWKIKKKTKKTKKKKKKKKKKKSADKDKTGGRFFYMEPA